MERRFILRRESVRSKELTTNYELQWTPMISTRELSTALPRHKFRFVVDIRYRSILGLARACTFFFRSSNNGKMGQPFCAFDFKSRGDEDGKKKKKCARRKNATRKIQRGSCVARCGIVRGWFPLMKYS